MRYLKPHKSARSPLTSAELFYHLLFWHKSCDIISSPASQFVLPPSPEFLSGERPNIIGPQTTAGLRCMTAGFPSHSCFTDTYDCQLYSASFSCGCLTAYTASDIPKALGYISSLIPRLISFLSSPSNFIITKLEHNSTTQNVPLRLPPRLQGRISTPRPPREAETAPTGPRRILGQHHFQSSRESIQHLPALSVCQHTLSH